MGGVALSYVRLCIYVLGRIYGTCEAGFGVFGLFFFTSSSTVRSFYLERLLNGVLRALEVAIVAEDFVFGFLGLAVLFPF